MMWGNSRFRSVSFSVKQIPFGFVQGRFFDFEGLPNVYFSRGY